MQTLTLISGAAPSSASSGTVGAQVPSVPLPLASAPAVEAPVGSAGAAAPSAPAAAASGAGGKREAVEELLFGSRGKRTVAAVTDSSGKAVEHRFWDTQPVPKTDAPTPAANGPIDAPKTVADVRQEPYTLPAGFEWCTIDVTSEAAKGALLRE